MIYRNLTALLKESKKSILLLGPRQVGKSTLIQALKPDLTINLADQAEYFRFTSNPSELRERIETKDPKTVFIDEVQKHTPLLNTIQVLADENKKLKFYLTGSSARKLKRGRANLLPGRVLNFQMGPLVSSELSYKASTEALLKYGGLPEIYLEEDENHKKALLRSYLSNYVQEEIRAEAIVRNVDSFSRALPHAFKTAGQFVDYSKLAKQAKVSRHSLSRFYEIFEDTLVGMRIWPDEKLEKKADLVKHPKFFAFDIGVYNVMAGSFEISEERKGVLFEHLIFNQIVHSAWSKNIDIKISTFRSRGGLEVDFILTIEGKRFALEAKAVNEIHSGELNPLIRLRSEYEASITPFAVFLGKSSKKVAGIWCHPWQELLREMGL
jgi:uncharacterized protein